jgi:hypothetical protein
MKKIIRNSVAACFLVASVCAASAQDVSKKTPPPNTDKKMRIELAEEPAMVLGSMKITLGQAMEWAVKQNYDLLSESYDVAMVDTQYNQFLKKFAPVLSAEVGGGYSSFVPGNRSFYGENALSASGGASIYKNFSSGTTVVAGLKHQYVDIDKGDSMLSTMSGPANAHKPMVFVSVHQELLKNSFGYTDRKVEEILKNSMVMKKEGMVFMLSLVVVQVVGEYWNTVMAKIAFENAELQVKETRKVRDITARNAAYGLADDFTLRGYNAMLAGAEAKLTMTRQKYREALRSFLTTINVDENMEVTGTAVFSNRYPPINVEEALKTAYTKRADYRIAVMGLETAKLGLDVAKNNSLPSLSAEINGALNSEHKKADGAYMQIGKFLFPGVEGKLNLQYPLCDKEVYTQERNARFKVKQAEIQLQKSKRSVKDDIMNATDEIDTNYRAYQKMVEMRKQSELCYQGMMRDLALGRLSSAVVKNALDGMVQSREAELGALVLYNISLLKFDVARNVLFEKYGIDVDKYIPKDTGK